MARIAYGSITAQGLSLTERPKCLAKLGLPQRLVALFVRDNHAEYHKTATQQVLLLRAHKVHRPYASETRLRLISSSFVSRTVEIRQRIEEQPC